MKKKKNIYPLFGSSDDDRYDDGLFIGTQKRKHWRSDSENHDHDDDRKTRSPRKADHHHDNRK